MILLNSSFFKKYLLPGFVFQSVIIAGGYGTGRELIEYFMNHGPLGGILGMFLITLVMWAVILAVTFEFSRIYHTYDYRTLMLKLLGSFWFVFEFLYFVLLIIVLAVAGSAAGVLLRDNFGIPYIFGVMILLAFVGFFTFKGGNLIEKFLSSWSLLLYAVYGIFLLVALLKFGPKIQEALTSRIVLKGWHLGGFKYALYNIGVIPAVLFCIKHIETRKEAISAGLIAGVIGIIPAFLFYVSVVGFYPEVLSEEIPAFFILRKISFPFLFFLYQITLFGTLIETGTGFIHAVNERIQSAFQAKGKEFPKWQRPLVALGLLLISLGISTFGLINLIAKGYGSISWGIFIFYFIPLMTIGVYRIIRRG